MFAHRTRTRRSEALQVREEAAAQAFQRPHFDHLSNGEEDEYRRPLPPLDNGDLSYVANYSKGLPHTSLGEVDQNAYRQLLRALDSRNPDHFEQIPLGMGLVSRPLINPQAGLAFDLEGPDAQAVTLPPAPRIDQPENSAEMAELYWMARCRDVHFQDYGTGNATDDDGTGVGSHSLTIAAAQSLSRPTVGGEFTAFRGPMVADAVTPGTLFRGFTPGDLVGPYLSQFLLKDIVYGTLVINQQQLSGPPGDFLTTFPAWLAVQNGLDITPVPVGPQRYICTLRGLANYVHFDALYEAYLNACLILLDMKARFDPGNPYVRSATQDGFGTFGAPHVLTLVTEVATRALKAVWFQKWAVHRRLRPEEFGGRIQVHLDPALSPGRYDGLIDVQILDSLTVGALSAHYGPGKLFPTFLLPQAFEEGSPTHPAYGAGHATVAGACVTILKAWFDESDVFDPAVTPDPVLQDKRRPVVPNTACTGLDPYVPFPAGAPPLTVGGELNKLAANIALGRNAAGVHWRSDYTESVWLGEEITESVWLGEEIAIRLLQEQKPTYNEDHRFTLTRFDGTLITI